MPTTSRRAARITAMVDAMSIVVWAMQVNVLWLVGVAAGGIVLGVGPSSSAVATLVRAHLRGDLPALWPTFWRAWSAGFVRANLAYAPNAALAATAVVNLSWFAGSGPMIVTAVCVIVVVVLALTFAWLPGILAYYDLPAWRASLTSLRLVVLRPLPTVLMALSALAVGFVSWRWVILVPLVSVGALLYTTTYLAVRTFDQNEDALAAGPQAPVHDLPVEPLRMH